MVQESVERSPKRSLRRRSQFLNLSMSTGRKVIVADLNKYRIQTKQKLIMADKKDMAEKMAEKGQIFERAPHIPDFSPQLSSSGVI